MQLALTATFTDNTTQPVTSGATYMSSDPTKATVDGTGKAMSLAPGTVTITATYMGKTTTFTLAVTAPGTGGLVPNAAPAVRPVMAEPTTVPPLPLPPTRAAAPGGGSGPQASGEATPTPRPAPPMR
jgi:hypothetical protein